MSRSEGPGAASSCVEVVAGTSGDYTLRVTAFDLTWVGGEEVRVEDAEGGGLDQGLSRASGVVVVHVSPDPDGLSPWCVEPEDPPVSPPPPHDPPVAPPEACGECAGKVSSLELRYLGRTHAEIEVWAKKADRALFAGRVAPGETVAFDGDDDDDEPHGRHGRHGRSR